MAQIEIDSGLAHALQVLRPLTQEERELARENARNAIIGTPPDRKHFAHAAPSKFPAYVQWIILTLCIVLLIAAFLPSAIRLHHIGVQTFMHAISDAPSLTVAGWSAVLLAETGQLVFTLALAVLDANRSQRIMLYGGAALCTCFALVGNVQLAQPASQAEAFAWLEAIAPPLVVLVTAHVLKYQMLHGIEQRHATEREYQVALMQWKQRSALPEQDASWRKRYANALRDSIRKANNRSDKGRNALHVLTLQDWYALVEREMQADEWYLQGAQQADAAHLQQVQRLHELESHNANLQDAIERLQSERTASSYAGNHTGEIATEDAGAMHSATCPHCGYAVSKPTRRAASNAMAAHLRGCKERAKMQESA